MGVQAKQRSAASRVGSRSSSVGSSSSSGKASNSAPRSVTSQVDISRYDGNRDPAAPTSLPPATSRPHSPRSTRTSPQTSPQQETPGADRNPSTSRVIVQPRNFDLGARQWSIVHGYDAPSHLPSRPKQPSKLGQETKMGLNTFGVDSYSTVQVYQFDVQIGNGVEKRGVIQAVWKSKALQSQLGSNCIFDGNRLAWSTTKVDRELRLVIDLDKERGRTARPGKEDIHRVVIRQTNRVRFDVLAAYLKGGSDFDNSCLEAINFLDHVLRELPSRNLIQLKRCFFPPGGQRTALTGGVEAVKGVYQSLRVVLGLQGPTLSVNVDVANGTFFQSLPFLTVAMSFTGRNDVNDLVVTLRQQGDRGRLIKEMKRLRRVRVITQHRGTAHDEHVVDSFIHQTAREYKFDHIDSTTGQRVPISIWDYFLKRYNTRLNYPEAPLVKMTKGAVLPMEVLHIKANQRYRFKLDERQTSNMIKVAVTPPNERWTAIQQGLNALNWQNDPVLKAFGLRINPNKTAVPARVLQAPRVQYGQGVATPGTSGRWDLKGKKFLQPNPTPLKTWAVTVIGGRRGGKPDRAVIENFIKTFISTYINHGGRVENKQPKLVLAAGDDPSVWVTNAWNAAGQQTNSRPQMLVFVLPDKDAQTYGRIKRSADCRYGVVSQCMQYSHVQKGQPQYISNVCMKFNSKLGGITARAIGPKSGGETGPFTQPTIVIGADVSHAAPGSAQASMAALTVSMDKLGTRFAAAVDSNGHRVEMVTQENIDNHLQPLIQHWCSTVNNGKLPNRVLYLRDGVSEGQYQHVLDQEVHSMKAAFKAISPQANVQFVVVIGGKRHHVRFFPENGKGDRNNNPLPGTLVEGGVTHPFENDFYLCSHAAIKGTARPTHYHVILNEANMSNDELYTLLYEQVYQYARATTPVSIHPAIYYAHIASNRAVSHDPRFGSHPDSASGGRTGSDSTALQPIVDKLMPMPAVGGIKTSMWYI